MNKIRIAILDDDKNQIEKLREYCFYYFNRQLFEFEIKVFNKTKEFLKTNFKDYDLLLLDIEMPDNNGIEIAYEVRKINKKCFICFITNYSDYLYKSYDVHAFDYIMKPIDFLRLSKLFDEVIKYRNVQSNFNSKKIALNSTKGKIVLYQNQILYFEYHDKFHDLFNRVTKVETTLGTFILKEKISSIYKSLPQNEFVIPHKSFIVNLEQIKMFKQDEIIMHNNVKIPLSQRRAAEARKIFNNYINSFYQE